MIKYCYRLEILGGEDDFDKINGQLALHVPFGWEEEGLPTGESRFIIHCDNQDFMRTLRDTLAASVPAALYNLVKVEAQDWLASWRQYFTPICCGSRFVVLPPWLEQEAGFSDRTRIVIEPKSAFGTGHHATTALCLRVLSNLLDQNRIRARQTFLDLGTGSGILGIACCKCGLTGLCVDIDPLAIDNARENCVLNWINCELAAGSIEMATGRTFDLVLSNILAAPLIEMAPLLLAARKKGGCLVLSGLLTIQADKVEYAYTSLGLPTAQRLSEGEWCALIWQ